MYKFQKHELNAIHFLSIETPFELCRFLKTPLFELQEIMNAPVYENYVIKKKGGGSRRIFAPDYKLKILQKRLNYFLQAYYLCIKPAEVHGFVVNPRYLGVHCNIVANASIHTGKKHVLNIDLKEFFQSISAKQIKNLFTSPYFNYNEHIATALTLLTTYRAILPTGAATSPVLSNFICRNLDADLKIFCRENGLHYTRYADDLTFSSDETILQDNIQNIIQLINKNGFEINKKKMRLQSSNRKQTVTGLTVNEKVNVDRKLLKKIRAMLHDGTTNGIDEAAKRHFNLKNEPDYKHIALFVFRLKGYINFVGQVRGKNDCMYEKMKQSFDKQIKTKFNRYIWQQKIIMEKQPVMRVWEEW